jgi:hypothetical protein
MRPHILALPIEHCTAAEAWLERHKICEWYRAMESSGRSLNVRARKAPRAGDGGFQGAMGWPAHKQQIMDAVLRNAKVQE